MIKQKQVRQNLFLSLRLITGQIKLWTKELPPSSVQKSLQDEGKYSAYIAHASQIIRNISMQPPSKEVEAICHNKFSEVESLFHQGNSLKDNPSHQHNALQLITLYQQIALAVVQWQKVPHHQTDAAETMLEIKIGIFLSFFNEHFAEAARIAQEQVSIYPFADLLNEHNMISITGIYDVLINSADIWKDLLDADFLNNHLTPNNADSIFTQTVQLITQSQPLENQTAILDRLDKLEHQFKTDEQYDVFTGLATYIKYVCAVHKHTHANNIEESEHKDSEARHSLKTFYIWVSLDQPKLLNKLQKTLI